MDCAADVKDINRQRLIEGIADYEKIQAKREIDADEAYDILREFAKQPTQNERLNKAVLGIPLTREDFHDFINTLDEEKSQVLLEVFAGYLPKYK